MTVKKQIKSNISIILQEISKVLEGVDEYQVELLMKEIIKAKIIVVIGAGRMGLASKAFAMRLGHMGLTAYSLGDSTLPAVKKGDLIVVCSGSGETQTMYDLTVLGKQSGAKIALISSYIDHNKSRMAKIADTIVVINAPSKVRKISGFTSVQPMTTLNEQCLTIFFDSLVLLLMEKLKKTSDIMWKRHSNLE